MLRLWTGLQSRPIKDADGASMAEYAFLIALIAMVVLAAALFLGTELSDDYSEVDDTLQGA